jgi:hypothetical protein
MKINLNIELDTDKKSDEEKLEQILQVLIELKKVLEDAVNVNSK